MKASLLSTLLTAVVMFTGCKSSQPEYVGKTYPPTSSIQVFYAMKDVPKPNEVMGKIHFETFGGKSNEEIINDLKVAAMKQGADAILIDGISGGGHGNPTASVGIGAGTNGNAGIGIGVSQALFPKDKKANAKLIKITK